MTQTEFEQKDMELRKLFREAIIEKRPDEAKAIIRQHRELCKAQRA